MIEVKEVSFSYNGSKKQTLSNMNFKIEEGESVGIIGANGAGKSTILKLLVGLELNYQGNIMINNEKVEKQNLQEIRQKIADGKIIFDGDTKTILQNKDLLENNGLELPLSLQRR